MDPEVCNFAIQLISWDNVAEFLNSNFTAALAGALAGALVAQRIGDRAKQRESMLQEIRSTNAAIMASFAICNAGLALKEQFTKDIYDTYTVRKTELSEFQRKRAAGLQLAELPFEFQADFRTLQMPVVPIDVLRTRVYDNISTTGRPLALVAALVGSISSLADVIHKRNALIERFRNLGPEKAAQLSAFYFGLPYGPGHVSTEFSDTIESLYRTNDDVIFFSELMGQDLMAHGNRILDQYRKVAKIKKEKISTVDFTESRNQSLMPNAVDYPDWFKKFPNEAQQHAPPDAANSAARVS